MPHGIAAWVVACAVVYLLGSYALGGPVALGRALIAIASRRRARYRGHPDEVLASSRFTIPVSVILPIGTEQDITDAVEHLLGLTYPEHEVIVVAGGTSERAGVIARALRPEGVRDLLPAFAADPARPRALPEHGRRHGCWSSSATPRRGATR